MIFKIPYCCGYKQYQILHHYEYYCIEHLCSQIDADFYKHMLG